MNKYRVILNITQLNGVNEYFDFVYEAEDMSQVIYYVKSTYLLSCGIAHIDIKELTEDEKIKINIFNIKPDDIIVLETEENFSDERIKSIKEAISGVLPNKIMILDRLKLSAILKQDSQGRCNDWYSI